MKFTTIIPSRRNDGGDVGQDEIDQILRDLAVTFGGCTLEGATVGHWIDPSDAQHYRDTGFRVSVECERLRLADAERAVRKLGERLDQKAMYFEVRDYDGVQILVIE